MNSSDEPPSLLDLVRGQILSEAGLEYGKVVAPTRLSNLSNTKWEKVGPEILASPVSILRLSKGEGTLAEGGLATVEQVLIWASNDYLPHVRGFGKTKRKLLEEALEQIQTCSPEKLAPPKLHPSIAAISTEGFHFGPRAESLAQATGPTLEDVFKWHREGCKKLPNFGKTSIAAAKTIISGLEESLNEEGLPDWEVFCSHAKITLLPEKIPEEGDANLLSSIPGLIIGIIESTADKIEADILRNRLMRASSEQLTLAKLSDTHGVTRERIRQKEKKLLSAISSGLMEDFYASSDFRFRTEYANQWKKAEEAFGETGEVDADTFLQTLCKQWDASAEDILLHLPFILAVLTTSTSVPEDFRMLLRYPLLLGNRLPDIFLSQPVGTLYLKGKLEDLKAAEIETVGELIQMFRVAPKEFRSRFYTQCFERLEAFLQTLSCPEDFTWENYLTSAGRALLPDLETLEYLQFIHDLRGSLLRIVDEGNFYSFTKEILLHRAFPPKEERLTAEKVAQLLGTHGPTISRNEREMNQRFRAMFIDGDFSKSEVVVRESFRSYWRELDSIYVEGMSVGSFKFSVISAWGLAPGSLESVINLIWGVLTNHPPGKNRNWYVGRKKTRRKRIHSQPESPPVIVLRRRRTVH